MASAAIDDDSRASRYQPPLTPRSPPPVAAGPTTGAAPLCELLVGLGPRITAADAAVTALGAGDPVIARLQSAPGVGRGARLD